MAVMIGIDPHKGSHTAVAVGAAEQLVAWAAGWPERTWAVEGAPGLGRLLGQQLVAAGERVLDVQPKLAARVRLLHTGNTGKSDPNDALSAAVAALRSAANREVAADDHATVLKVWAKRHRDLSRAYNQVACRLHAVLCELVPGGVPEEITAGRAGKILAQIRPAGAAGQARCELAAELLADVRHLDGQRREVKKKLAAAVKASGTTVTSVFGVGPVIAATIIGDVVTVARFPARGHFAAYNGTAPVEVSSGEKKIYRAVAARQPQAQPRHPHGRDHPDLARPQQRPRLLRAQDRRGEDPQRSPALPEAADQRRYLRSATGRCSCSGPGRATGGPLFIQGGRLTPRAPALRASHSQARNQPTSQAHAGHATGHIQGPVSKTRRIT
jgi:transposase